MSRPRQIAAVIELLRALGHGSALVGGLAVSVRARERFTKDVDLAVAVDSDAEAEALAFSMQREGFNLDMVVEQEAMGRIATLRLQGATPAMEGLAVDLLCASCGIEREIVADATMVGIDAEISVPVAELPHLIATKVLAVQEERDQDASDLHVLLAVATAAEVEAALEALRLIERRGFHRGKDLEKELQRFLPSAR